MSSVPTFEDPAPVELLTITIRETINKHGHYDIELDAQPESPIQRIIGLLMFASQAFYHTQAVDDDTNPKDQP
ncbi:MAG: hypothetical protein LBR20_02180 [Propionibacteriaceae bacterium]|jgi:hypothetical protein|nr:hypothetical protein [Propionibacteriaceae bacterium]